MRFAVGYQLPEEDEEPLTAVVREFRGHIDEVYFPWLDMPSGRSPMSSREGAADWEAQERLEKDLGAFKDMGVKLDLLLNASCYGRYAASRHLANLIFSVISHLQDTVELDAVTTTSPVIAELVKTQFPRVDVRASVNMRIGTVKGMQYMRRLFDSFYVQREYNRDLERIAELKAWADANGKRLYALANSGCLNFCSAQTFHDNLVAHEAEAASTVNIEGLPPAMCWTFYRERENWPVFLQGSWVRPEDVHHYERLFPVMKLATRMHADPRKVITAYCRGEFTGNLLDLLEPGHGALVAPRIIDNASFPDDWFERTTACDRKCHHCDYCAEVLKRVLTPAAAKAAQGT